MIDAPLSASVLQAAPGFMAKEAVINSPISKTIVEHPDTKASFFVPFTKKYAFCPRISRAVHR